MFWNNKTGRYERFADQAEVDKYKAQFKERMMKRYGKTHLLDDAEHQKTMLANRKISGKYKWADGTETVYTGTYELEFLELLDKELGWDSKDVHMPAPDVIAYKDPETGKERAYIPDVWLAGHDLLIEIKSSENNHYRKRDLAVELA